MSTVYGLDLNSSHADISYSRLRDAWQAIHIMSGVMNIATSSIKGKDFDIFVQSTLPVLMMNPAPLDTGGIGNALQLPPAIIHITNSSFTSTTSVAINNTDNDPTAMVGAMNNWWGSPLNPSTLLPRKIIGFVNYMPWLTQEPDLSEHEEQVKPACCSSVLFIPGLEASRLYRDQKNIFGFGKSQNTLWEPNRNDDVRALFLRTNGSSTDSSIYSGGPIDSAWGQDIYGKFMNFLDNLVSVGSIGQWAPFGYDWRKPIAEVVLGKEKKATTTISLIDTVQKMASTSKTGKVTIIAHSNGGLVAKYLVKTLADMGKSDLIDSVISVAVPYLGTPEAIGGILHGDDEELAGGLLLRKDVARQLGQNMPSAYSLLPSQKYFDSLIGSNSRNAITFSSTTPTNINNGSYSQTINSAADLYSYITDTNNTRVHAASTDTDNPIIGNRSLMASAGNLHDILDNFSWPTDIARWAVVGWNAMTSTGLSYAGKIKCAVNVFMKLSGDCVNTPVHNEVRTNMGDGTVYAKSASDDALKVASIDLHTSDHDKIAHANILESSTTETVVGNILTHDKKKEEMDAIANEISKIPGVTIGEPDYTKEANMIVVSTHSPVELHIYDEEGNHTGLIPAPAGTEPGLYTAYENNIPGSDFEINEHNDGTADTEIYLRDDGRKYNVEIYGTGLGEFTFDVDRKRGGEVLDHAEYSKLPVTALTFASTSVELTPYENSMSLGTTTEQAQFNNQVQNLSIDVNGDGISDMSAVANAPQISDDELFTMLAKVCTKDGKGGDDKHRGHMSKNKLHKDKEKDDSDNRAYCKAYESYKKEHGSKESKQDDRKLNEHKSNEHEHEKERRK
jgi:hypothetical protein